MKPPSNILTLEERILLLKIFYPGFHFDLMYQNMEFKCSDDEWNEVFRIVGIPEKRKRRMNFIGGHPDLFPDLHEKVGKFVYDYFDKIYNFDNPNHSVLDELSGNTK